MTESGRVQAAAAGSRCPGPPGGVTLETRPVRPDDVDGLAALYEELSELDRFRRFFSFYRPDDAFLERVATPEAHGGFGSVAVATDPRRIPGRLVAEASYALLANGNGELAITVAAPWRGGLGRRLLHALMEAAASRGVPNLEGDVLVTNMPMLALARSRGAVTAPSFDTRVVRVVMATRGRLPTWPVAHDRPRVLVETPAGHPWRGHDRRTRAIKRAALSHARRSNGWLGETRSR